MIEAGNRYSRSHRAPVAQHCFTKLWHAFVFTVANTKQDQPFGLKI